MGERGGAFFLDSSHLCTLPSAQLELASAHWAVAGGLESKSPSGDESYTHCCWSMKLAVAIVRRCRVDSQYHGSARCCWL